MLRRTDDHSCTLALWVVPGASRNGVVGVFERLEKTCLKVTVTSPPEGGKANKAVIQVLSDFFHVPKSRIHLHGGGKNAQKVFLIEAPMDALQAQLATLTGP